MARIGRKPTTRRRRQWSFNQSSLQVPYANRPSAASGIATPAVRRRESPTLRRLGSLPPIRTQPLTAGTPLLPITYATGHALAAGVRCVGRGAAWCRRQRPASGSRRHAPRAAACRLPALPVPAAATGDSRCGRRRRRRARQTVTGRLVPRPGAPWSAAWPRRASGALCAARMTAVDTPSMPRLAATRQPRTCRNARTAKPWRARESSDGGVDHGEATSPLRDVCALGVAHRPPATRRRRATQRRRSRTHSDRRRGTRGDNEVMAAIQSE